MYKGYNLPGGAGVIFFGYKHGILATIPIGSDCSYCYWELHQYLHQFKVWGQYYPLAIENSKGKWSIYRGYMMIYLSKMAIFHGYVKKNKRIQTVDGITIWKDHNAHQSLESYWPFWGAKQCHFFTILQITIVILIWLPYSNGWLLALIFPTLYLMTIGKYHLNLNVRIRKWRYSISQAIWSAKLPLQRPSTRPFVCGRYLQSVPVGPLIMGPSRIEAVECGALPNQKPANLMILEMA